MPKVTPWIGLTVYALDADDTERGIYGPFDRRKLSQLAQTVVDFAATIDGEVFTVFVVGHGGVFEAHQLPENASRMADGRTLLVFDTSDDVILMGPKSGTLVSDAETTFGPSIFAPGAKVTIDASLHSLGGFIFARELDAASLEMRGQHYRGPLFCVYPRPPLTPPPTPPTLEPTPKPTRDPCFLPPALLEYALVVQGDARLAWVDIDKKVAVGGRIRDGEPTTQKRARDVVRTGGSVDGEMWNFERGHETGPLSDVFTWSDFEFLATALVDGSTQRPGSPYEDMKEHFKVVVYERGGTFSMADFRGRSAGARDRNTLVVFSTHDDVVLSRDAYARQWGPSVFAPFSKVILKGGVGFVDGFLVARELDIDNGNWSEKVELHGKAYKGQLSCRAHARVPPTQKPTRKPTRSPTRMPTRRPKPAPTGDRAARRQRGKVTPLPTPIPRPRARQPTRKPTQRPT